MKILLISDVHSNVDALRAIEDKEKDFDLVLCLGDLMDWGMFPRETIQWFRDHKHITVSGNHDRDAIRVWESGEREPAGKESSYLSRCVNLLQQEDIDFLRGLPMDTTVTLDGYYYYLTHTFDETILPDMLLRAMYDWRSQPYFDEIWNTRAKMDVPMEKRRILHGHSHQCWMHLVRKGGMYINPGSIHYRLGYDTIEPGADYIVINDGIPEMKHVDYPTARVRKMLENYNFRPEWMQMAWDFAKSRVD